VSKHSDGRARGAGAASLAASLVLSCAVNKAPIDAPLAEWPAVDAGPPARRPDGVVLEPPAALPGATMRAGADGVIALREPVSFDLIAETVEAVADAWQRGQLDGLLALLATDAGPFEARSRGRAALIDSWRQRLRAHDYGRLANVELVRRDRIAHWEWDELGGPNAPARPRDMRAGEILVRAPLEATHVAGERLFGDAMLLVLRLEDRRLKVAAYGEADGQP
jgi:hypothetical protein